MKKIYFIFLVSVLLISCEDSTPPKIFLKGDLVMDHILGKTFIDPGYTAIDDEDGDITDKVKVDSLNVNRTGTQVIQYSVEDNNGNMAEAYRTITIYNEADTFAGIWEGQYVFPYPGHDKQTYLDSISSSNSVNMNIIIHDFAGNTGADIEGTVVLQGVIGAPTITFNNQSISSQTLTTSAVSITENYTKITIEYTLGDTRGVLVLAKQ